MNLKFIFVFFIIGKARLEKCFLDKKVYFEIVCNDLTANVSQIMEFNQSANLSLYQRIFFNDLFKNQILENKNLNKTIDYFKKFKFNSITLSYSFIKGIDINFFHTKIEHNFRYNFFFYDSIIDLYSNGSLLNKCNTILKSSRSITIDFLIFSVRNSYKRKFCPLLFQNTFVSRFLFFNLIDSFYKKNVIHFENSIDFRVEIQAVLIKNSENIILDERVLNKKLFKNVEQVILGGKLKKIETNTFENMTFLKIIRLDIYFARNFLHDDLSWIKSINKNINIKLDDRNQAIKLSNKLVVIDIFHADEPFSDATYTANEFFANEDFCIYVKFPFNQMILLSISDGIQRNNSFNFTCTYHFIRTLNRLLYNDLMLTYFKESILHDFENISHCDFIRMFYRCESYKFKRNFDYQNFKDFVVIIDFITLNVINPVLCAIGLFFTLLTTIFLKPKTLKQSHYIFLKTYSGLCSIYFILTLTSLVSECPFYNGMFCSYLWTWKYVQYYNIIVLNFARGVIKFTLNSIIIGFTYSRFINVKCSLDSKLAKDINLRLFLIINLSMGFILNILIFFFLWPNHSQPLVKSPFNLIEDDILFKNKFNIILKYLNLFYESVTNFLLFFINIIIDWVLFFYLKQVIIKNIDLKKKFNMTSRVMNLQNNELRHFKVTFIVSIINSFFKLLQTLPVIYSFMHFFTLENGLNIETIVDAFMVKICFKFSLDRLIIHFCHMSYCLSLFLNFFFYFCMDKTIIISLKQICFQLMRKKAPPTQNLIEDTVFYLTK